VKDKEPEKLVRMESQGIRPFMRLMIGEHVISEGPDMELKRAMELLDTAAESFAQRRVDEAVKELKRRIAWLEDALQNENINVNLDRDKKESERVKPLVEALMEIGNVIGGPTMSYSPKVEREELLNRVQKVGKLVVKALGGLK